MKNYWKKFKIFWKELGNILTNFACPFLAIVASLLEVFGAPISWAQAVKKAEYYCWQACGTKKELDKIVDVVDEIVECDNNDNN